MHPFNYENANQDPNLLVFVNALRHRLGANFDVQIHNGQGIAAASITIEHNNNPNQIHTTLGLTINGDIVGLNNISAVGNGIYNMQTVVNFVQAELFNNIAHLEHLYHSQENYINFLNNSRNALLDIYNINVANANQNNTVNHIRQLAQNIFPNPIHNNNVNIHLQNIGQDQHI